MKRSIYITMVFLFSLGISYSQTYLVNSPNRQIQFQISAGEKITYSVVYQGGFVINHSTIALKFSQAPLYGENISILKIKESSADTTWMTNFGTSSVVRSLFNGLEVELQENSFPRRRLFLMIRVYNDGIAFRYRIPETWSRFIPTYENRDHMLLREEMISFDFPANLQAWVADYGGYDTHQEEAFLPMQLNDIPAEAVVGTPLLVKVHDKLYAAITEADLTDWAGMYLKVNSRNRLSSMVSLKTDLSPLPGSEDKVRVRPGASSPWRVILLGESAGALIESQIIFDLNDACAIEDTSWIVPGISAWDHWWSGEVQMDTETIKKYITLAADMGWEYMLIDWHWYGPPFTTSGEWRAHPDADITTVNPDVDMPEVIAYAKEKNVKLLLWLLWDHVDKQMDEAFPLYETWGISGVKIDFMARDDQEMVNWYHKVVKKAAEHHLAVDFHGAYKPTGWSRTYPNLLTREGVLGNEYSKWSARITPEHNVTLPFTRMLAGQMDYTPGAFLNVRGEDFRAGSPAMVMNTRAHQLAMFVVYFSPLTVACDHPDHYRNQPGIQFLKEVPTVWDKTLFLSGEVGEYIAIARRKGRRWYIGAMNNSIARGITIKLDFLEKGNHSIIYFRDMPYAGNSPAALETGREKIKRGQYYFIKMAPGGGFAGWIEE